MQDYQKLKVWQAAHTLAVAIYRASAGFPAAERFGLTSQIRRAASSAAINIAEGCGRGSTADTAHFMQVALGSAFETEALLLLAKDLDFLPEDVVAKLQSDTIAVKRMLAALKAKMKGCR